MLLELSVAPFTGAWIEIDEGTVAIGPGRQVAPFTGAWIEIPSMANSTAKTSRRTLHGCVD